MSSAWDEIVRWDNILRDRFPTRLVGELVLSENDFRSLIAAMRAWGFQRAQGMRIPSSAAPFVTLTAMVFTARYDYEGSFWQAFARNLGDEELNQRAWGDEFLRLLARLKLVEPPQHAMKFVVPVLFHSIIPERSREPFGKLVRGLCESLPIRDMWDDELVAALGSVDLPVSLRAFVNGGESQAVAIELLRQVASDYEFGVPPDPSTVRGKLLEAAMNATADERQRFHARVLPLRWRWDFDTGRFGVWVGPGRTFDDEPLMLRLLDRSIELNVRRGDNTWSIIPALVNLGRGFGGRSGSIEGVAGTLVDVRVASAPPDGGPYIFRAGPGAGTFEPGMIGTPGFYAVADNGNTCVFDATGAECVPLEELLAPPLSGATRGRLYELDEGFSVRTGARSVFEVARERRPTVLLRSRSLWSAEWAGTMLPVFTEPPSVRVTSPFPRAELVVTDVEHRTELARIAFEGRLDWRLSAMPIGATVRASVEVDARHAGTAASCIVLPFLTSINAGASLQVIGDGEFQLPTGLVPLSPADPATVSITALATPSGVTYRLNHRLYDLHYTGPQPTLWGRTLETMERRQIVIPLDTATRQLPLLVSGRPGSSVALTDPRGDVLVTGQLGGNGFTTLSLDEPLRRAQAVDRLAVSLRLGDDVFDALLITSAPTLQYESFRFDDGCITATIALDRTVAGLTLRACVFNAPWSPIEERSFERLGPTWQLDAELFPQRYDMMLRARMDDGTESWVLKHGVPHRVECGLRYEQRSDLDCWLWDALQGTIGEAFFLGPAGRTEAVRRVVEVVLGSNNLAERERAENILSHVAPLLEVGDVPAIEAIVGGTTKALRDACARCGIPFASFASIIDPRLLHCDGGAPAVIFAQMAQWAQIGDDAIIGTICDHFEPHDDPLIRAYAALLRRTRSRRIERTDALEQAIDSRAIKDALADMPRYGGLHLWLGDVPSHATLFTRASTAVWGLALAARRTLRDAPETRLHPGAGLASQLLVNEGLAELMLIALTHTEHSLRILDERDAAAC